MAAGMLVQFMVMINVRFWRSSLPMNPVTCSLSRAPLRIDADAPPAELMWMPSGVHTLHATREGVPVQVRVRVDPQTASTLQAQWRAHMESSRQRPFFDFDHRNEAAAAWPLEFVWRDAPEPGVYARVEWSDAGAGAVVGRTYRAFSPAFLLDDGDPARVTGAPLNMGGLVNDPAFLQMRPLWASSSLTESNCLFAVTPAGTDSTPHTMTESTPGGTPVLLPHATSPHATLNLPACTSPVVLAAATPPERPGTDATAGSAPPVPTTNGSRSGDTPQPPIAAAETELWRQEREELHRQLRQQRAETARAAVQAATARGALPPQNTDLQEQWQRLLEQEPAHAALLAALPSHPALGTVITASSGTAAVVADDSRRVIQAYAAARPGGERGAIWARDLRARVARGDESVIQAANTLGTLVGDLVTQRALDLLKLRFPVLNRISTDFSPENAAFNQTIRTRIRTIPGVTDYSPATGYATSDVTSTDVNVTLNAHKAVQIAFTANDLASTRRMLFGEQEEGIHYALGKSLVDALYALLVPVTFPAKTIQALAGFGRATVVAMARDLSKRGVPTTHRTLLLYSDYFAALASDSALVSLAAYQRPEIITGYQLPNVAGFDIYEAVNLPPTGNLTGFGFSPDALILATRLPNDYTTVFPGASGGGVTTVVTNPDTGMSVMLVQYLNHQLGQAVMRVAFMFGVAAGQTPSGQLLVSA